MIWHLIQLGRALSRLLNALTGGEGDTTFSAGSEWLRRHGRTALARWAGRARVRFVDWLNGEPGHCAAAYAWHAERDLFIRDTAG